MATTRDAAARVAGIDAVDQPLPVATSSQFGSDARVSRLNVQKSVFSIRCWGSPSTTLASWAEEAKYRTNVIQALLAHRKADDNGRSLGSQDIAYMRATLFEERRALHEACVAYVTTGVSCSA